MPIFLDQVDYRHFVYVLGDVVEHFDIACWNYCLMPNHYHLTLQPRQPNFSEAVHRLNSVYALWWNRRHARVGHVFQGRFKDQIVEREGYLLALSRYVVMNPVRAQLAERPEDWAWSSYRATVGLSPCPPFLAAAETLRLFGDADVQVLRARFVHYLVRGPLEEELTDRIRSAEPVLGGSDFKAAMRASSVEYDTRSNGGGAEGPERRRLLTAPLEGVGSTPDPGLTQA